MSTILKALKRLDEERRADAAPRTLQEQVLAGGGAPARAPGVRRDKWLFGALGATGVLLALGGVFGWRALRDEAPKAAAAPPPVAARAADPQEPVIPEPQPPPFPTQTSADEARDPGPLAGLRAQSARGAAARAPDAASALPAAGHQPEPGVGLEPELVAADSARAQAVAAAPVPTEAAPAPAVRASEPAAPPAARAEPTPEPARAAEPDVALVPARPEVWVERTQWHPTPAKRSAFVRVGEVREARELHEGEGIDGVVVKEIRPSGVLFLYEGEEFKRGVGGS